MSSSVPRSWVLDALAPRRGERVGPGTGEHATALAEAVGGQALLRRRSIVRDFVEQARELDYYFSVVSRAKG